MQAEILKLKIIERYLNKVKFNRISIGSLLAQYYALNFIDKNYSKQRFTNLLVLLKYSLTLWNNKKIIRNKVDFIFTKLNHRFHFNALINPLISHYEEKSVILCDENSFDKKNPDLQINKRNTITFTQTNSNYSKDAGKILSTIFTAFYLLFKNRERLQITTHEIIYLVNNLLVQLRRASFWNHYFYQTDNKPLCIVTEFDRCSEATPLVLAAKKHKIPTITLIHGVLEDYSFTPFLADYIFCWGESQKLQLINKCIDQQRIIITGNPMFNHISQDNYSDNCMIKSLNICLAISPGFNNRLLIEPFISALNNIENVKGIIKLHPSIAKEELNWVKTNSTKIDIVSSSEINNSDLFNRINLLIINDSGIANEALVAGIPVLVYVPRTIPILNNFQDELIRLAGCTLVTNEIELTKVFIDIDADLNLYRSKSVEKSKEYLKMLYNTTGVNSVITMISQIDKISKGKL